MRTTYLVLVTIAATLVLSGCSSQGQSPTIVASNFINNQSVVHTTTNKYPSKDPQHIALFKNKQTPTAPYKVIAHAKVSKHTLIGSQRKDETVHEMMKKLAASIGGDGLIEVNNGDEHLEATVIQFQKILI